MEFRAQLCPRLRWIFVFLILSTSLSASNGANPIGICYGRNGDNLPTALQAVSLVESQQISRVRIFDADSGTIQAFQSSGIQLMISVKNEDLAGLALDSSVAASWITTNVVPYVSTVNISYIAVGSEVMLSSSNLSNYLVPALENLYAALVTNNLNLQIKLSSPNAMTVLEKSYPPSEGTFDSNIATSIVLPMLAFLSQTRAPFMLNSYPYYAYVDDSKDIPLEYALFESQVGVVDSNTNLHYISLFDAQVDAVYSAMNALNYTDIPIVVTETGWPSKGDDTETAATVTNANTYNQNLIDHVISGSGTPLRSGQAVETYIFSLYNEDQKAGPASERNFGAFNADGTKVYELNFYGGKENSVVTNETWCVANSDASNSSLLIALNYACGPGRANCNPILSGGDCYLPDTYYSHASWAFNSYYQGSNMDSRSCNFSDTAILTEVDPSYGKCIYPARVPGSASSLLRELSNFGRRLVIVLLSLLLVLVTSS